MAKRKAKTVNAKLVDEGIKQRLHLERFGDEAAAEIIGYLQNTALPRIAGQIQIGPFSKKTAQEIRLMNLRSAIQEGLGWDEMVRVLSIRLKTVSSDSAWSVISSLEKSIPVIMEYSMPSPDQLYEIVYNKPFHGKIMSEWFAKVGQTMQENIYNDFKIGMLEGKSSPEMAKFIFEKKYDAFKAGGIMRSFRDAETVTRTAISITNAAARDQTFIENEDVLDGVEWIATLDDRTDVECMVLHGNVYPINEGPRPPLHYNCRCTIVPVVKSWKDMGLGKGRVTKEQMASMDGQVSKPEDYDQWLKSQPADVQDEALGPVRAQLYRDEKLSLDDMVSVDHQLINLDELGYIKQGGTE